MHKKPSRLRVVRGVDGESTTVSDGGNRTSARELIKRISVNRRDVPVEVHGGRQHAFTFADI